MTRVEQTLPPAKGFTEAEVDQLLRAVQAAPSVDNSQPWRITVFAD